MYSLGFFSHDNMTQPPRVCPFLSLSVSSLPCCCCLDGFSVSRKLMSLGFPAELHFVSVFLASTATRGGHHGVLRAGSGAGGIGRHVLQQLLPLPALGPGPGSEQRRQFVATERATGHGAFCRNKDALRRTIVRTGGREGASVQLGWIKRKVTVQESCLTTVRLHTLRHYRG